jgi:hypothetical protein
VLRERLAQEGVDPDSPLKDDGAGAAVDDSTAVVSTEPRMSEREMRRCRRRGSPMNERTRRTAQR